MALHNAILLALYLLLMWLDLLVAHAQSGIHIQYLSRMPERHRLLSLHTEPARVQPEFPSSLEFSFKESVKHGVTSMQRDIAAAMTDGDADCIERCDIALFKEVINRLRHGCFRKSSSDRWDAEVYDHIEVC